MPYDSAGVYRPHRAKISMSRRAAVYIRDNWTCQECGRVFIPEAENLSGRYAPWHRLPHDTDVVYLELDHIHPRSLGGDDSEDNLRSACTPCNKRKLATTMRVDWVARVALAQGVLEAGPADEETCRKAAAVLIGCLQRDVPTIRGRKAEVDLNG